MSAELPATLILGAVPVAHDVRPNGPCRAELGDLLEEVVMGVEEETESRREAVYRQAPFESPVNIFDSVAQREGKFLNRGRSSLSDVIAANRNRIKSRGVLNCIL